MQSTQQVPMLMGDKIILASCQYYSCTKEDLKTREFAEKRKIVSFLLRMDAMLKYKKIADMFDKADHSWTVKIVEEIESQKEIYAHISHDIKNIRNIVSTLM